MSWLIVTAVPAEADAIGDIDGAAVIVAGIGRTNAAAATTQAIIERGPFEAVLSAGVAGALPGSGLDPGAVLAASACIYAEEGLITSAGFADMQSMGFALGDFAGNAVPVDADLLEAAGELFPLGPIATVATCSGTDHAAAEVARRTGALAEAMEGAAVVHAARRLGARGLELRGISNTTGDRARQRWDLPGGLSALGEAVRRLAARVGGIA